ncbi:anti-sigma factor [Rhodobium gokarnense]|uniref:Regulator of SigK n=1 Tax=Rhodobium gokarnense TaxID=364296 RepID=A0ABT3HC26_9HYPH|nr:anti-sigma factor [Rhodobium gokarnense]MCW2307958.1 anti-sigma-K factor RskA [Rhodobium gokarnense]
MSAGDDKRRKDDAAIAEYALGVLPAEERAALSRRLQDEPDLQADLRAWEERFAPVADEVVPVAPPAETLSRIEDRLFGAPAQKPGIARRTLLLWQGLSAVSLAALVVVAALFLTQPGPREAGPTYVSELTAEDKAFHLVALYDGEEGVLRLHRTTGAPAGGHDFELWLIEGGNAPISLGLVPRDPAGRLTIPGELAGRLSGATLAVSDEPAGGSPTGAPTGPVVATGAITPI